MKTFLHSRLVKGFGGGLVNCASAMQHLCMRVAVALSLKLCMFTARVLLGSSARSRAEQAF